MDSALLFISRLAPRAHGARVADARESLAYWSRRADELPWRRRAARREARERVTAARAQLIGAHLEHTRLGTFVPHVTPLLDTRGRSAAGHARSLALITMRRTPIGRKLLLGATAASAGVLAIVATAVVVATHLLL